MKEYSAASLLTDVINIVRAKVSETTIRFAVSVDSSLPAVLIGDEPEVRNIFFTFLENAISCSDKGFVSLFVFGKPVDESTIELVIDVTCSGCRQQLAVLPQNFNSTKALAVVNNPERKNVLIYERREAYTSSLIFTIDNLGADHTLVVDDDEFHEKIESRFYNYLFIAHEMYKRNKEIVDAYSNKIKTVIITNNDKVVSEQNLETLVMPAYCISIADILNGESPGFIAPNAKVLIVDDININLHITKELLVPYKMQVDLCNNGRDAVQLIKDKQYDLVFMDNMMPGMSGIEAVKQIRAFGGNYEYLPIIALSANISTDSEKMFIENGFNGFLPKPINSDTINAVLQKWLLKKN